MSYERLMASLRAGDIVVLDGATGTEMQRRGAAMDAASWSGPATLSNDRLLQSIHADYIRAGARVVTANTFAASPLMLAAAGLAERSGEIILEMMYEPSRVKLALEAALSAGLPDWFGLSARRGATGKAVSFHAFEDLPLSSVVELIPAQGVDVAGVMHSGAEIMQEALDAVRAGFKGPLMAYPDSGYFEMPDWRFVDIISPARFEEFCVAWLRSGVQLIGGCCGLGLEHIEAASRARASVLAERQQPLTGLMRQDSCAP